MSDSDDDVEPEFVVTYLPAAWHHAPTCSACDRPAIAGERLRVSAGRIEHETCPEPPGV